MILSLECRVKHVSLDTSPSQLFQRISHIRMANTITFMDKDLLKKVQSHYISILSSAFWYPKGKNSTSTPTFSRRFPPDIFNFLKWFLTPEVGHIRHLFSVDLVNYCFVLDLIRTFHLAFIYLINHFEVTPAPHRGLVILIWKNALYYYFCFIFIFISLWWTILILGFIFFVVILL